MSISLQKGQKVSLTKDNAGLAKVVIGLGWDQVQQKRGLFAPKPAFHHLHEQLRGTFQVLQQ